VHSENILRKHIRYPFGESVLVGVSSFFFVKRENEKSILAKRCN
jgi:hypothetical protein